MTSFGPCALCKRPAVTVVQLSKLPAITPLCHAHLPKTPVVWAHLAA